MLELLAAAARILGALIGLLAGVLIGLAGVVSAWGLVEARRVRLRRLLVWAGNPAGNRGGTGARTGCVHCEGPVDVRGGVEPPPPGGWRLVHLSDLHVHRPGAVERQVEGLVERADPDLVVITGDFIDADSRVEQAVEVVARLARRWQVVAVLGNHDHDRRDRREALVRGLRSAGVRLLENRRLEVESAGVHLNLVGVDSPDIGRANLGAALRRAPVERLRLRGTANGKGTATGTAATARAGMRTPGGAPDAGPGETARLQLLLAHTWHVFDEAEQSGIDLVLTGDTHGGQIDLPLLGPVWARWVHHHRYIAGLYKKGRSWLFVNRGTGTIGVPMRFRCPPEVVVVDIVARDLEERDVAGRQGTGNNLAGSEVTTSRNEQEESP